MIIETGDCYPFGEKTTAREQLSLIIAWEKDSLMARSKFKHKRKKHITKLRLKRSKDKKKVAQEEKKGKEEKMEEKEEIA